jgi:predicted RND superfamily exporter protein
MGGMAWLKIPIYPMTTMIPILLMAMGVAYGIHIIARYYIVLREQRAADPGVTNRTVILATMMELWSPLIMASTTDAAGFLSLLTNKMKPVFYTGVFTSLGLLAALLFALVLVPAALALMKPGTAKLDGRVGTWEDRFFGRLGTGIFRRRKGIVAASVAVLIVSLVASRGLVVDSDPMSNFNQSDPIPIATKVINRLFSGAMLVHVVLESPTEKRFLDPAALAAVDRFQAEAARIPEVGATFSAANLVKMWQQAMNGGDPARKVVPPTRGLVANYLNFTGENANRYITMNRDRMNVELRVASTSTKVLGRVLADLEKVADRELRTLPGVTVRIGGHAPVLIDLVNVIVWGQVWSIVLSGILVFLITSAMFRSPVAGLFCAGPITLATAFNFGTMAVLGIRLEPATAVTACIGIGVGVDYGIHFIAKYKLMRARGFEGAALVESTMASAGKAIFFNAAVVIGGFLVLVTSQFPPSRHMGFMVSLNMFTSYLASVTVLPAMLAAFRPRFCEPREEEPAARAAA